MPPKFLLLISAALALGGCTASLPEHLARPADPAARVPALAYLGVAAQTKTFRPAGPKDWEELNRRVGPQR